MSGLRIRPESPADGADVERIVEAAFGRRDEALLVRTLRGSAAACVSLVAEAQGELLGHVCFSPVSIEGAPSHAPAAGLAPLAVSPAAQRRGIGAALVVEGLRACVPVGWRIVFVLGSPAYYSRFGFRSAPARGLRYGGEPLDSAFQVLELVPGALAGSRGWVRYHPAFAGF